MKELQVKIHTVLRLLQSLMIYFMNPIYAAGAVTEKEIESMKADQIRN